MRIMGPPTGTWELVLANLTKLNASKLFLTEIAPAVWGAAIEYAVDPVVAVAQSYKETGGGNFGRATTPWHRNTCGLKIRDLKAVEPLGVLGDSHPLAHAQFATWHIGARAHVQHLRAYAGCPIPADEVVDPRYDWVIGRHRLETVEELGGVGRWAPSPTYGVEVATQAAKLVAA